MNDTFSPGAPNVMILFCMATTIIPVLSRGDELDCAGSRQAYISSWGIVLPAAVLSVWAFASAGAELEGGFRSGLSAFRFRRGTSGQLDRRAELVICFALLTNLTLLAYTVSLAVECRSMSVLGPPLFPFGALILHGLIVRAFWDPAMRD